MGLCSKLTLSSKRNLIERAYGINVKENKVRNGRNFKKKTDRALITAAEVERKRRAKKKYRAAKGAGKSINWKKSKIISINIEKGNLSKQEENARPRK